MHLLFLPGFLQLPHCPQDNRVQKVHSGSLQTRCRFFWGGTTFSWCKGGSICCCSCKKCWKAITWSCSCWDEPNSWADRACWSSCGDRNWVLDSDDPPVAAAGMVGRLPVAVAGVEHGIDGWRKWRETVDGVVSCIGTVDWSLILQGWLDWTETVNCWWTADSSGRCRGAADWWPIPRGVVDCWFSGRGAAYCWLISKGATNCGSGVYMEVRKPVLWIRNYFFSRIRILV
jgi:hypothetical protein